MAPFFDFIGRMIEGRPVFDNTAGTTEVPRKPLPASTEPTLENAIRKGDEHSFPVVYINRDHISTHTNDDEIEVYGHIVNTWHNEILLDKIRVANTERRLNVALQAGEEHEVLIYKGPKFQQEYHEAWLDYKTQEAKDYFRAVHDVSFTYHDQDKTYTIDEMHLHHPIRDIYE